ncbi:cation diffusion facilitator family transporter [Xanthobacter autotrophicus]|uniref:cation diffusion facilitator family transporter n=1 Tax=Xanthobacter TaxID=279 RepID=UPI00145FB76F|nr:MULTISPECIES: cation diffusion facilitator family transporter [Xanthobacter]NMN60595.1 cation diffusion facilitator family transporter [Xanthobacter sp. SG618]UDQ89494.1 cation diffusion facilitator family transporter [Xanthobacter autotrophicus]
MSRKVLWIAAASVLVGAIVLGLKTLAWWVTGSVALLSDALESIINVAASAAALFAITVSARPADDNHQFGHHKAEYLSAVLEGVLVVVAAVTIMREAYYGFLDPHLPDQPFTGMLINGAATVINAIWCLVLLRVGKSMRSPALVADGKHVLTDVVTSAGVLIGFVLVPVTGWPVLDPLIAGLVALNVLWTGWSLMKESVGGLMDAAPPPDVVARIRELVSLHAAGAIEAHDLRTRHAGRITFVEFHLVVPGDMTVAAAHDICDRIENAFERDMDDAIITIHVEPEGEAKHRGVVVV